MPSTIAASLVLSLALVAGDAQPPSSRFAAPAADAAQAARLASEEARAIAAARRAVAEMRRLAVTPDEKRLAETDGRLVETIAALVDRRARLRAAGSAGGDSQDALLEATRRMQETQASFDLQYLQLQSQMQHENRSYTAVSNIMKTKHDTVKNAISNIR